MCLTVVWDENCSAFVLPSFVEWLEYPEWMSPGFHPVFIARNGESSEHCALWVLQGHTPDHAGLHHHHALYFTQSPILQKCLLFFCFLTPPRRLQWSRSASMSRTVILKLVGDFLPRQVLSGRVWIYIIPKETGCGTMNLGPLASMSHFQHYQGLLLIFSKNAVHNPLWHFCCWNQVWFI